MSDRLLIIDGSNLAFRAYAVQQINNKLTNGCIYGTFSMVRNLIKQFPSYSYGICWDIGGETSRHKMAKKYINKGIIKSKYKDRDHSNLEEYFRQLEVIRNNINLIGINSYEKTCIECDDLIGSFSHKFENEYNVLIISNDKDFQQLINDKINLYRPVTNEIFDVKNFIDKYGIEPYLMLHVGALTGDGGDNIEGINGIGEKTAISIIKKYGSLHNLLKSEEAKLDKSKKMQSIFQNEEKLKLAYYLKKINRNVDYEFKLNKFNGIKSDLKTFFEKMNFNSFLEKFNNWEELK